jgi:hypothetical protein
VNAAAKVGAPNATYADLPAPRWAWEEMPAAPVPRLDGSSVQIGDLLYVFAGYANLDHVSNSPSMTLFLHCPFLLPPVDWFHQYIHIYFSYFARQWGE